MVKRVILVIILISVGLNGLAGGNFNVTLDGQLVFKVSLSMNYRVVDTSLGELFQTNTSSYLMVPGKPILPSKNIMVPLPLYARVEDVVVKGLNATQLPGVYSIAYTPLPIPLDHKPLLEEKPKEIVYSQEKGVYPGVVGELRDVRILRGEPYALISIYPFNYYLETGRVVYYRNAEVIIKYSIHGDNMDEHELPINQTRDTYVIITTNTLYDAVNSSGFIEWKRNLGYNVKTILVSDEIISGQPGVDLAEQIRNFLREYYLRWSIKYVLLVGDYRVIPMRYCYPSLEVDGIPTDYYYADLSSSDEESWDYDRDGVYGEYGEDKPDFLADVYVGRIPTSDIDRVVYTLNKIISFERDTGEWKHHALNAGAFFYFTNETPGHKAVDGATCMDMIEREVMSDWLVSHYSEQEGVETSTYKWKALNEDDFTFDWRENQYGIVNWAAHGWSNRVARKVWVRDDGDNIPEFSEIRWYNFLSTSSNLDDDYPSIVFAISCRVGAPEQGFGGRLGVDLLTKPFFGASSGIISSTRTPYGTSNWPIIPGGAESICLEFNRFMIKNGESIGKALYHAKYLCNLNYSLNHYAEYCNMFTFNLYGDPSMVLEGVSITTPSVDIMKPSYAIYFNNKKIVDSHVPIIFGSIDIVVNASDTSSGIDRVDFYIDDRFRYSDDEEPYCWSWSDTVFFRHEIKVVAYNLIGREAVDRIEVLKFF